MLESLALLNKSITGKRKHCELLCGRSVRELTSKYDFWYRVTAVGPSPGLLNI